MKSVDIKGNITLVTEPHQIEQLFDSVKNTLTHRTRPIKNEDKTVILSVRKNTDLTEQVFVVLVSMKFSTVKNTSLRHGVRSRIILTSYTQTP